MVHYTLIVMILILYSDCSCLVQVCSLVLNEIIKKILSRTKDLHILKFKMADNYDRFSASESDFSLGSDSEIEEETIWYHGQVQNASLTPYSFEPVRSQRQQSPNEEELLSDSDGDNDSDGDVDQEEPGEEGDGDQAPVPEEWKQDPSGFCSCNQCSADTLTFKKEAICCYTLQARSFYDNHGNRICCTKTDEFQECVETQSVLKNQLICLNQVRGDNLNLNAVPNKKYRWMAYTAFTWWIYQQKLGYKMRRVIPACVVARIRTIFPLEGDEELFVPYAEAQDSDDDAESLG